MNSKIIFATLLAFTSALFGQDENADSTTGTLEEISVKGVNIRELGLTGSSLFTTDQVEDRQIKSIADLSGLAPNFYVNSTGQQSFGDVITLRGIGNTQLFGDPAVSLYVDGIPVGNTATFSTVLFDLEEVEVLRGSQGHRFGKNSPAGVINIKTRRPGTAHRSKLHASYGTFDTQSYRILADGPTGEDSTYYFGINQTESDGFADNIDPLGNDATSRSLSGRLGFNWSSKSGIKFGLGGTWENFDLGAQPLVPTANSSNLKRVGFYDRSSAENEVAKIKSNSQFIKFSQDTELGTLMSVTTRNEWQVDPSLVDLTFGDSLLSNLDVNNFGFISSTSKIVEMQDRIAKELSLMSSPDVELQWKFGLSFSKDEIEGVAERSFPTSLWQEYQESSYQIDTDSLVFHGWVKNSLTDNLGVEIGLRYEDVSRDFFRNKIVSSLPTGQNWTNPFAGGIDDDFFSPIIKLTNEINDRISLFAKVSKSFKPGGFSPYVDTNSTVLMGMSSPIFSKEKNLSYEIGANLSSQDQVWNLALTAFWNKVDDYQFEKPTGTTDYFVDNAEEVEIFGLEMEFIAKPSDRTTFSLSYGLTDGEINKHSSEYLNSSFVTTPAEFSGMHIPFSPEYTLNASLNHLINDNLSASLGICDVGEIHYLDYTATDTVNDSYTLLNANFGYMRNGWEFNLFGTNLTDEEYYSSLVSSLTGVPGVVGSPRVVGLSVSREF